MGAGLYVAAYCLLRLALRLTLLIYTVVLLSQPTEPTGAVGVLSALGFLCVILAVIHGRTAALAGRKYRESCRPAGEPGGSATSRREHRDLDGNCPRLNDDRVPTAQGGLRCRPATVRSISMSSERREHGRVVSSERR